MRSTGLSLINFLLLGNSILIGWNSVISSLDFFIVKFDQTSLPFFMAIPCNIATIMFNLLIGKIAKYINQYFRIVFGLLFLSISLILFPISALVFSNSLGYLIFLILNFVANAFLVVIQCSVLALVSTFPNDCMTWLNAGFSVSGVLITLIRIILLCIFDESDQYNFVCMLIYYGISFLFVILSLFVFLKFHRETERSKNELKINIDILSEEETQEHFISENIKKLDKVEKTESTHFFKLFWLTTQEAFPYSILMFILYSQTFFSFPGLALGYNKLHSSKAWNEVILVMLMNCFDLFGRYSASLNFFSSKVSCSVFVTLRFLFCITFSLLYFQIDFLLINNNYFCIINMILFAFTHGYSNCILFIKGPETFKTKEKKEIAEYMMAFSMNIGMAVGSLLALAISY